MQLYKLLSIKKTCDNIKIFRIIPLEGEIIKFEPGQFLMLSVLDEKGAVIDKRPYSIASAPSDEHIELAIKMINGRFTSKLDLLKEGEIVGVEGPFGHFIFNAEKKAVFIAGGVGLTPLLSILRTIIKKKIKGEYILLYSCKTKNDILYKDELKKLEKAGIKIKIFLTRENIADMGYESGRIEKDKIMKYVSHPKEMAWFMCGPLAMMTMLMNMLIEIGVPKQSIKFEGWG